MNRYYFPLKYGGLGDKFCMFSVILRHRLLNEDESILYLMTRNGDSSIPIGDDGFKSVIDFFHFVEPDFHMKSEVIHPQAHGLNEAYDINFKTNIGFKELNMELQRDGNYWPINFTRKIKNKFCYMLYEFEGNHMDPIRNYQNDNWNKTKWFCLQNDKCFSTGDMEKFYTLCEYLPIKGERLEDYNFARNVEILAESKFIVASEGMWTHLSRAMKIPTIAYTTVPEWNEEINSQGHFCSPNVEEVFFEVMKQAEL